MAATVAAEGVQRLNFAAVWTPLGGLPSRTHVCIVRRGTDKNALAYETPGKKPGIRNVRIRSLTAFLYIRTNKLFCVFFQNLVNLVK